MNIVIAPDSFKGSLTAREVGQAIRAGVEKVLPHATIRVMPMADGGEGTTQCLIDATKGEKRKSVVRDPLGKEIEAEWGILGDGETCVMEMAASSGLYLVPEAERNPMKTTSFGFGQLLRAGLDAGCRRFILGLGGSATNDGGAGMLQALGLQLQNESGHPIPEGGEGLRELAAIRTEGLDARLRECTFLVACDVTNPFVGPTGASHVFGPQKGATGEQVMILDACLRKFADLIEEKLGIAIHDVPGSGAAGGVSGALLAFLGATLVPGVDLVKDTIGLAEAIRGADLVITGEGQVDFQTAHGKTPCGVARTGKACGVPVLVLAGSVGKGIETLYEQGVTAVFSIVRGPIPLQQAMGEATSLLEQTAEQAVRLYVAGTRRN